MHYGRTLKFFGFVPALSVATLLTACGGGSPVTSTAAATTSDVSAASTSAASTSTESTPGANAETSTVTATNAVSDASSGSLSGPGATQVFSYPNGFASAGSAVRTAWAAGMVGSAADLTDVSTVHAAGAAWYTTQQNVSAFTTDFTFQIPAGGYGITFAVQNSTEAEEGTPPWSGGSPYGTNASGDANMLGYGAYNYPTQYPIRSSIGVKFDASAGNSLLLTPKKSSATGLYINGGPVADLLPQVDMQGSGINVGNGDVMAAHFVYDGSVLTMVLRDTVTNAQFRTSWPVNIASVTGNSAYFGFTGGTIPVAAQEILSWSFSEGYAQRLPIPTFSVASGSYTSQQTVSLSAYTGATIYYTTNGQQPTSSSTKYAGPITVSSNEVVQAVAIESGYTDSLVGAANYQIQPAASPLINFPSGFTNGGSSLISVNGTAQFNGSAIELTDSSNALESGSAWYVVPVNVQSFTTSFTLQMQDAYTNGITFTIQNQNPGSTDSSNIYVTGGPNAVSNSVGLGYSGSTGAGGQNIGLQTSVAVKFDLTSAQANTTGLFTDGADTSTSGTQITGVNLAKGNPIKVTLSYNGTTLSMTMTDTVTNATFSTSWPVNIPSTVSGNTAYVGFTAGTGWGTAPQQISNWTFSN